MSSLTHLSYSSIRQYIDCGLQFRFRKIDQLEPEFVSDSLVFGSCVHKALAKYNQHRIENKSVNSSELGDWFEGYLNGAVTDKIRYSNGNDYKSYLSQGKKLLETFYNHPKDDYDVLEIEKQFSIDRDFLPLSVIGYIDLVETDENGNLLITEYKTSNKAYSRVQID